MLLAVLAAAGAALPTPRPPASPGAAVYRRALTGVAWLLPAEGSKGTGWVIDVPRRRLVTAYHVVGDSDTATVVFPWHDEGRIVGDRQVHFTRLPALRQRGLAVRARVVLRRPESDLAVLEAERLPEGVTALPLAEAAARVGERVHLVGNRYDVPVLWSYGGGAVQARRTLRDGYFSAGRALARGARALVAGVPINEGDSGGPLLNDAGQVVGVAAAVAWEGEGAGLFIDLSELRRLFDLPAEREAIPLPSQPAAIYRRAAPAVTLMQYEGGPVRAGVLIDRERRLVLTTAEAVGREARLEVVFPVEQRAELRVDARWYRSERELLRRQGYAVPGVVLALDARRNLALVDVPRLPPGVQPVTLAQEPPHPGDELQAISHPRRLDVLWTHLAATLRQRGYLSLQSGGDGPEPAVLLMQAAVAEGEGGGPVLDRDGRLVGLLTGRSAPQQQVAYALEAAEVRAFLAEESSRIRPQTADEHRQRGERFRLAHEDERAEAEYTAALRLDPHSVAALLDRSGVRLRRGQHDLARADAERALQLRPGLAAARCRRGAALAGAGKLTEALAELEAAIQAEPRQALAHVIRGEVQLRLGRLEAARADADAAIWLDDRSAPAYRLRGQVRAGQGDLPGAIDDLGRAIALDPFDPLARIERAERLAEKPDRDAALADWTAVLKRWPNHVRALHGRARLQLARGESDAGLADLAAVLRLDPDRLDVRLDRAAELLRRGHTAAAVATWRDGIGPGAKRAADVLDAIDLQMRRVAAPARVRATVYDQVLTAVAERLPVSAPLRAEIVAEAAAARRLPSDAEQARRLEALASRVRRALAQSGARPAVN